MEIVVITAGRVWDVSSKRGGYEGYRDLGRLFLRS